MLELPTGAADLSVTGGTLNPIWLAYALDSSVSGVEAGDIYVRHGSGESAPPHPSVKLGETDPDDPTADARASDGPVLDAREATIDDATIKRLAAAVDANGQDITGVGTLATGALDSRQGYVDKTASRNFNTWYQNTTGSDLDVSVTTVTDSDSTTMAVRLNVNDTQSANQAQYPTLQNADANTRLSVSATVPDGYYYQVVANGDDANYSMDFWKEQQ
jgi:hypothetical protein